MATAITRSMDVLPFLFSLPALRLFELGQRAEKILGVEEQHRLAVRADLRVAVAENAGTLRLELVARGDDVVDLVADVMDAAVAVLLQELGDRRVVAQRLQEFDLGVRQVD